MLKNTQQLQFDERGATMLEYALMVALLSLVCVAGIASTGEAISAAFRDARSAMPSGADINNPPLVP